MGALRTLTPAHIRQPEGADYIEVMFLESARIFRLFRSAREFDAVVRVLRDAIDRHGVVQVRCTTPEGEIIQAVTALPPGR